MLRMSGCWIAMMLSLGMCCRAIAGNEPLPATRIQFNIDAPTMEAALIQFTQQSGLQLVYPTYGAAKVAAPKLDAVLTPRAALERLLKDSGLKFEFVNTHTVLVTTASAAVQAAGSHSPPPGTR